MLNPSSELKLIIGHRRPEFNLWPGHRVACLNAESSADWVLENDAELANVLPDSLVGEYYFLFLLRRQLERYPTLTSVTISQYRRFASKESIGRQSGNQPYANVISIMEAGNPSIGDLISPRAKGWLVSSALPTSPTVSFQYALHHHLRDWYRFLSDSFDAGVLSQQEVAQASFINLLIPAPSTGVFPAKLLITHLSRLELFARSFKSNGYQPRDNYQRRVIGFCLERMHSFLILSALANEGISYQEVCGQQIVISDDVSVRPTI